MNYIFWLVLVAGVCQCQVTTQCSANCGDTGCDDKTGDCYTCQVGYYGPKCGQDCGLCVRENCSSRACTLGCKAGYFQVLSVPELSYCQPCKRNCATCSNSTYCTMCNEGFYLTTYINQNGRRETQCNACSTPITFCTSCNYQQNGIFCNRCSKGYGLSQNTCVVNNCTSTLCLNGCDSIGICYGCDDGLIGSMCSYRCNSACAKCSSTQNICDKCSDNFYSQTCLQPCNLNCLSLNNQTCKFIDGKCLYGCNNGFWGDWCENECSVNCKEFAEGLSVCFRNGTCALGCKEGFEGDNCTQEISITTTLSFPDKEINECESSPCENGATCIDKMHGFSCMYAPEYKEIDECESSPCENGATCTDKINGYSCIYAPEYKENERYIAVIGGLSAAVALLFVALVVLAIHKLRSRSKGVSFKGFCCRCQNTKDQTETYASLQIQQPSKSNEYDVMESTLSVQAGTEPETVQSQNRVEYINTTLDH